MPHRRLCLPILFALLAASNAHARVSVFRDRAIVLVDNKLYVMAKDTLIMTEYLKERAYGKLKLGLPPTVKIIGMLGLVDRNSATGASALLVIVDAVKASQQERLYLSAAADNTIVLVKDKSDKLQQWTETEKGGRGKEAAYNTKLHAFTNADKKLAITVAKEEVEVNVGQGKTLTLNPLVLGEPKDAAEFETIEWSGK